MTHNSGNAATKRLLSTVLVLLGFAALLFVVASVWIIQPFKPQTQSGLNWSFFFRRWSPILTILTLIAGIVTAIKQRLPLPSPGITPQPPGCRAISRTVDRCRHERAGGR